VVPLATTTLFGSFQVIPTAVNMSVPLGTTVSAIISAEGDLILQGANTTQGSIQLQLVVDGSVVRMLRSSAVNVTGFSPVPSSWHISTVVTLAGGVSHDIHLEARTISSVGGAMVLNAVAAQPGSLAVVLLRQ
jgi:hypothetical protein